MKRIRAPRQTKDSEVKTPLPEPERASEVRANKKTDIPGMEIGPDNIVVFDVTPKQEMFAANMSKLPEDVWNNPEDWIQANKAISRAAINAGYSNRALNALRIRPKIIELIKAKYFRQPYRIMRNGKAGKSVKKRTWTSQQEIFSQEMAADPFRNVLIAAERAGWSNPKYGYVAMQNPRVLKRIEEIAKERKLKYEPNVNNLLQRLFVEANVNMADYVVSFDEDEIKFRDSNMLTRDHMAGIQELKRTVKGSGRDQSISLNLKLRDSHKAQKLLFQFFGLGIEGSDADPRDFVQSVVNFSKEVSMTDAFPMEAVPSIEGIEAAITDENGNLKKEAILPQTVTTKNSPTPIERIDAPREPEAVQ